MDKTRQDKEEKFPAFYASDKIDPKNHKSFHLDFADRREWDLNSLTMLYIAGKTCQPSL